MSDIRRPWSGRVRAGRGRLAVLGACGLVIVAITYVPFVFVLANSMKNEAQYAQHPLAIMWTFHISNYSQAWRGVNRYLLNTIIVAVLSVAVGVPAGALGAYAFAQFDFKGKGVLFLAYLGLLMVPWTLTLIPLFIEVQTYHMFNTWWALILPYAAGAQPLNLFLFRTFFEQIPKDLYASARVDGCSELKILTRIVSPLAVPILLTGAVLMFVNAWGDYLWPELVLRSQNLQTASAGLETFLASFNLGAGSGPEFAAYVIVMVPVVLFVCGMMKYFVAGMTRGALKV